MLPKPGVRDLASLRFRGQILPHREALGFAGRARKVFPRARGIKLATLIH